MATAAHLAIALAVFVICGTMPTTRGSTSSSNTRAASSSSSLRQLRRGLRGGYSAGFHGRTHVCGRSYPLPHLGLRVTFSPGVRRLVYLIYIARGSLDGSCCLGTQLRRVSGAAAHGGVGGRVILVLRILRRLNILSRLRAPDFIRVGGSLAAFAVREFYEFFCLAAENLRNLPPFSSCSVSACDPVSRDPAPRGRS